MSSWRATLSASSLEYTSYAVLPRKVSRVPPSSRAPASFIRIQRPCASFTHSGLGLALSTASSSWRPDSLAVFQSAKCSNEENYLLQRMFRAGIGTHNVDHCTRLCHSSSVSAMQRAMATSAASGSMREIEHETDVIFVLGANTTESHPVFGAAIKRAVKRGAKLIVNPPCLWSRRSAIRT